MGITHLSICVSAVCVCLSDCLSVSLSDRLNRYLILPSLLSFFKHKLLQKADYFLLCKVVSFAFVCVCVYSTVAASQLLTSQVSQRPQQASVVMCSPPQPGFRARKVNSLTAQPMKRRRLTADTRGCRETQSRTSSTRPELLRDTTKHQRLFTEISCCRRVPGH